MGKILLANIKLIIWDLDDTFWKGTLSEGGIQPIKDNIDLVKDLTDRGIVNAICSKNDYNPVIDKLTEIGVADFFVFNSIDWTPKGERVRNIIKEMGLRPANTLFIDDNIVNLNEASFYCGDLMIAEPVIINDLKEQVAKVPVSDQRHSRLKNYKILEQKRDSKASYSDNESFLYSTNTRVQIKKDCLAQIDRIHELVLRTNQLNFTKNRMSKDELRNLLLEQDIDYGYVHVSDRFGDYGIVGFYAIKNNTFIHFLFSCRTIGQGVEQYVYSILNYPELNVVGDVINEVTKEPAPKWINQQNYLEDNAIKIKKNHLDNGKIVFKGARDLMILTSYIDTSFPIVEEFTYQGVKRHNEIEHHNHSTNYTSLPFLPKEEQSILLEECIFNDEGIFKTSMYDDDVKLLFLSTLPDPNLGIYRKKGTKLKLAFAEWTNNLTDPECWPLYINKQVHTYNNNFTEEWLRDFSNKYEYLGRITPEDYIENLKIVLERINPQAKICLLLGCELRYEGQSGKAYKDRELFHKSMNKAIRDFARGNNRIYLLDWTDYVKNQSDFLDNINHYQRHVYYDLSNSVRQIIQEVVNVKVEKINFLKRLFLSLGQKYNNAVNRESWYYPLMRKIFHVITDKRNTREF